ncbi:phosphatase PAP2 family protein [Planktothrix agardhii]|uniref:phosphatase PAP2 family protein n=1 Tax=Planktothrix agardhii TaxID=1160 RepID=UPI0020A82F5F|nr:phosphatase PAP2 family protein [Planktothrix agardhii]CAD5935446.1 Phosphatidylglycerophosphatase B [Planktothrix agardhii]
MRLTLTHQLIAFKKAIPQRQLWICLAILCAFILLSIRVSVNENLALDQILIQVPHQIFPRSWDDFFRFLYLLTGVKGTAVIVALTLVFLAWKRYWIEAKVLAFSTLGILILVDRILKPMIERSRPLDRLVKSVGRSFPSGHATGNILFYFFVAYLLAERYPKATPYIYGFATIWLLIIGFSSVYLRCHWPSDILAGYGLGYICLTISLAWLKVSRENKKLRES